MSAKLYSKILALVQKQAHGTDTKLMPKATNKQPYMTIKNKL